MSKKFVSTMRKGFHMTFENGLTASVQWGAGNYCDNHCSDDLDFSFSKDASSDTAEVAVWRETDGKYLNIGQFTEGYNDYEVAGYLSPEEVVDFLCAVKSFDKSKVSDKECLYEELL